jgi:hypothetical protein
LFFENLIVGILSNSKLLHTTSLQPEAADLMNKGLRLNHFCACINFICEKRKEALMNKGLRRPAIGGVKVKSESERVRYERL